MKLGQTIVALTALALVGCGGGLISSTPGKAVTGVDPGGNAPVPQLKVSDVAGVYELSTVSFDGDSAKTLNPSTFVTTDLKTVTYGNNGVPTDVKARISDGYLIIGSSGTYSFYYKFTDDNGNLVSVGPFQSDSMSGKVVIDGKELGFASDASRGLAADAETAYTVIIEKDKLTLVDVVQDTPTPHFGVIELLKQK